MNRGTVDIAHDDADERAIAWQVRDVLLNGVKLTDVVKIEIDGAQRVLWRMLGHKGGVEECVLSPESTLEVRLEPDAPEFARQRLRKMGLLA